MQLRNRHAILGMKEVSEVVMLALDQLFKIYQRRKFSAGDLKC